MTFRRASANDVLGFHSEFGVLKRQEKGADVVVYEMCFGRKKVDDIVQKKWSCVPATERMQKWIAKSQEGMCLGEIATHLEVALETLLHEVDGVRRLFPGAIKLPETDPLLAEKLAFLAAFKANESAENASSQLEYHQTEIQNAEAQFDEVETTVSHLFSEPHAALQGRTYGQAFVDAWNPPQQGLLRILEVGCGTGRFAKAVLERLQQRRGGLLGVEYTLMDVSPILQAAQKDRLASFGPVCRFVLGDAQDLSVEKAFPKGSFEAVLCNEVIADFDVLPYADASDEVKSWLQIPDGDEAATYVVHSGTFSFLKNTADVLSAEGQLLLTEYRRTRNQSAPVVLGNHVEYAICESQILQMIAHESWQADLVPLVEWLGFDDVEVISGQTWTLMARYLAAKGRPNIKPRAFGRDEWRDFCAEVGVQVSPEIWTRVGQQSFVDPSSFFCLKMRL